MEKLGFWFGDFDYKLSNAGNDLKFEIFKKFQMIKSIKN